MDRFLPNTAPEFKPVFLDVKSGAFSTGAKVSTPSPPLSGHVVVVHTCEATSTRMELAWWEASWDRYALAAAVLKQLRFRSAMAHRELVLLVAARAVAKKRGPLVGVLYCELSRRDLSHPCVFELQRAYAMCPGKTGRSLHAAEARPSTWTPRRDCVPAPHESKKFVFGCRRRC